MKKLIYPVLLLVAFASCGKSDVKEKIKIANVELAPPPNEDKNTLYKMKAVDQDADLKKPEKPTENTNEVSKKIIKEGDISFEAKDVKQTRNAIYNSLTKLGGYISVENETNNSDNRKEYNLKIRVPAKNFDRFLNGVTSVAEKIDSKNIRITDVTTEYIDITAQLANKKSLEERYLELLKKATKMADMLEIEDKLSEIRTDIESTQGRLNYLVKQVDYSSLDITFYSKQITQDNGNTFGYKLKSALADGWLILGGLFFGFLQVWPIWILIGLALYLIKRWRKKHVAHKAILADQSEK